MLHHHKQPNYQLSNISLLSIESVVKMSVTRVSADSSPREDKPNTEVKAFVSPWVKQGNPSAKGQNGIRGTWRKIGTPPGRESSGANSLVTKGVINPADVMVRELSYPINVCRGESPTSATSTTSKTTLQLLRQHSQTSATLITNILMPQLPHSIRP